MNKFQKEVEKQILENEKKVLEKLKQNYILALKDVKANIKALTSDIMIQSKIYQKEYQENLERQLQASIDLLSTKNFNSISEYLENTYKDGFIGTLYNMQNEGVPFIMPLNQETIIKSIMRKTEDFKLSKTLYKNATTLKKVIKAEISRGISQSSSYAYIAKKISRNSEADLKKSYRIARTEGGRVSSEAKFEVMQRAKANGAEVVKEWDSAMDSRTRKTHVKLDGQIKEIEEPFEVDGNTAMYPHGFGIASEDINCRCLVLERARWGVDKEDSFTKIIDGDIVEFQNIKDYQNYKKQYFEFYQQKMTNAKKNAIITELENIKNRKSNYFDNTFEKRYNKAKQYTTEQSDNLTNLYKHRLDELNINQRNSIADYTGIDYEDINRSLRAERKVNEGLGKHIDDITDVLNNSATVEDMIVHRHVEFNGASKLTGIKEYQLKENSIEELNKILKGKECTDKAFISTSIRDFKDELREVVYDIYMPKGTKGLYINELSTSYKDIEYEFLLQRETKFKIQEVFKDTDGTLRIVMEVIGNGI